ncbi:MAG: hypothetical protein PHQ65_09370 [Bacteroidales bacterium]|jgi:hypothetical protein|nr:hypothetical protein [Bacteroidales bacterium]MDD3665458.1 hypothetical protein [Bacteroidales bacterium]
MINLVIALFLLGAFAGSILYELRNAPTAEEQEDGSYRFVNGAKK